MSQEVRHRCIVGRDKLISVIKQCFHRAVIKYSNMLPGSTCHRRERCSKHAVQVVSGLSLWGVDDGAMTIFEGIKHQFDERGRPLVCNQCHDEFSIRISAFQEEIWSMLPILFGFDSWDVLQDLDV